MPKMKTAEQPCTLLSQNLGVLRRCWNARGANVNAKDHRGITALHKDALVAYVLCLLRHVADIELRNVDNKSPMHQAVYDYWRITTSLLRVLLDHGAYIACVDEFGNTPLHTVVGCSREEG